MNEGEHQWRIGERSAARQLCGQLRVTKNYKYLLPKVINLMAHRDIGVKRIAYSAYGKHSHKVPGEALLAINTLLQDSCHQSPLVRALVLNTLILIHNEASAGIHQSIVADGLKDTSAFVRRHAVISEYYFSLSAEDQQESRKVLIDDPDPIVSSLSLVTHSGKDSDSITFCLSRLAGYTSDGIVQVLAAVRNHKPDEQKQLLDILNVLDPLLDSEHIDIATAVMDIFLLYSKQAEESLAKDMRCRTLQCSLAFLRSSDTTHVYCMLLWLQECIENNPPQGKTTSSSTSVKEKTTVDYQLIADNYHLLLDKSGDPPYLTLLKLDVLSPFITDENVNIITDNIKSIVQSKYKTSDVCDRAIRFAISARERFADSFGSVLKDLLNISQSEMQICLFKHLRVITSYDDSSCEELFRSVLPRWKSLASSDLMILLNLSSHFAANHPENLIHILAIGDRILSATSCSSPSLKITLLHSVTQCFLSQPAEYHQCLIECLSTLDKENDQLISEQIKWSTVKLKHATSKS